MNTRNISGMLLIIIIIIFIEGAQLAKAVFSGALILSYCLARKKPIRCEKTKPQARTLISFLVLWPVFTVIVHNTINIPEIFQVFTVFLVTL